MKFQKIILHKKNRSGFRKSDESERFFAFCVSLFCVLLGRLHRFVLTLINRRMIQEKQFEKQADGAVWLNEEGRKLFLEAWQKKKAEVIPHPFLKEKVQYGMLPYAQALLLARYIRGDLEDYPAMMWK